MNNTINYYFKQLISILLSISLVMTGMPPSYAQGLLAPPGDRELGVVLVGEALRTSAERRETRRPKIKAKRTENNDEKVIQSILRKLKKNYDDQDYTTANEIASRIILAMSYEKVYKQPIALLEIDKAIREGKILDLEENILKKLCTLVIKGDGEDAGFFKDVLLIACYAKQQEVKMKKTKRERTEVYERMRIFMELALQFNPEDTELKSQLAYTFNHLGEREKAKEILKDVVDTEGLKDAKVNLGYVGLEMVRQVYHMLCEELQEGRFEEAIIHINEAVQEANEGKKVLWSVTGSYERSRRMGKWQISRAYAGIAKIDMVMAGIYFTAERTSDLRKVEDYGMVALRYAQSSFSHAVRSLVVDPNNKHSIEIYVGVVERAEQIVRFCLPKQYQGEKTVQERVMVMNKLTYALDVDYPVPDEAKAAVLQIRQLARTFRERKEFYNVLKQLAISGIRNLLNKDDYTEIEDFYIALKENVIDGLDENKRGVVEEEFPSIRIDLDYDLIDLSIIQSCLYYGTDERTKENITEYVMSDLEGKTATLVKDMVAEEIVKRFGDGRYEVFGFHLVAEEQEEEDVDKEITFKVDRSRYSRGDIERAKKNDEGMMKKNEQKYEKISGWLTAEDNAGLAGQITTIRRNMSIFKDDAKKLLEKDMSSKKAQGDLDSLKKKRVGEDGTGGYLALRKRLEVKLKHRTEEIIKRIKKGQEIVRSYAQMVGALHQSFGFQWLISRKENLKKIEENIKKLLDLKSKGYLSKERFDALIGEAEEGYGATSFIGEHKESLEGINNLVGQIEGSLKELSGRVSEDEEKDLIRRFDEVKEEYENIALSVEFEEKVDSIRSKFNVLLERFNKLVDIVTRERSLYQEYIDNKDEFEMNQGIYHKPHRDYFRKAKKAGKILKDIGDEFGVLFEQECTYENIDNYEATLNSVEAEINSKLQDAHEIINQLTKEKRELILAEVEYIENLLQRIWDWLDENVLPRYAGPQSKIKNIKIGIEQQREFIKYFKKSLKNEDIDDFENVAEILGRKFLLFEEVLKAIVLAMTAESKVFDKSLAAAFRDFTGKELKKLNYPALRNKFMRAMKCVNEFAFAVKIEVSILNQNDQPVEYIAKQFTEKENVLSILLGAEEAFRKWNDFEGKGVLPFVELLNGLKKVFYYYCHSFLANRNFPIIDAHTLLLGSYLYSFDGFTDDYKSFVNVNFMGERNLEVKNRGRELISEVFKEVNPSSQVKKWPKAIREKVDEFLRTGKTKVFESYRMKDTQSKKIGITEALNEVQKSK